MWSFSCSAFGESIDYFVRRRWSILCVTCRWSCSASTVTASRGPPTPIWNSAKILSLLICLLGNNIDAKTGFLKDFEGSLHARFWWTSEFRGLNLIFWHFYRFNEFRQFFCPKTWILQFYVSCTKEVLTHVQVFLCSNLLSKLYKLVNEEILLLCR